MQPSLQELLLIKYWEGRLLVYTLGVIVKVAFFLHLAQILGCLVSAVLLLV